MPLRRMAIYRGYLENPVAYMSGSTDTGRVTQSPTHGDRPLDRSNRIARSDRLRTVSLGYPRLTPLTTDEVEAYFDEPTITCLLCGRQLYKLHMHLDRIHSLSVTEYRERFGLPHTRGLVGTVTHHKMQHMAYSRGLGRDLEVRRMALALAHAANLGGTSPSTFKTRRMRADGAKARHAHPRVCRQCQRSYIPKANWEQVASGRGGLYCSRDCYYQSVAVIQQHCVKCGSPRVRYARGQYCKPCASRVAGQKLQIYRAQHS